MNKKRSSNRNIVSIDAFGDSFSFDSKVGLIKKPLAKLKGQRDVFVISCIDSKDVVGAVFDISTASHIPSKQDEIEGAITQKAYEELGLDQNFEHEIRYLSQDTQGSVYDVFIMKTYALQSVCEPIVEKMKYIDCIVPAPLLMQTLYTNNVIPNNVNDCFIYFGSNDAFLAIYSNGVFNQFRSLSKYSLNFINKKYCELTGNRISLEDFKNKIKKDGLHIENGDILSQVLSDCFSYISDMLDGINQVSHISVGNIYVGTEVGNIAELDKFVQDRLLIKSQPFNFAVSIKNKESDPSFLHSLMVLYAQDCIANSERCINFSTFLRPPPFFERNGGLLIAAVCAGFILGLAYPVYYFVTGYMTEMGNTSLQEDIDNIKAQTALLYPQLEKVTADVKNTQQEIQSYASALNFKEGLLSNIHDKKTKYPMKSVVMYDLAKYVKDMGIHIQSLHMENRNVSVALTSPSEKQITQFVEDIENSKIYKLRNKNIILAKTPNATYESNITVEVR